MATILYSIAPGGDEFSIRTYVGSAVAHTTIELTVDLAATTVNKDVSGQRCVLKSEVLQALDKLKAYIASNAWNPTAGTSVE